MNDESIKTEERTPPASGPSCLCGGAGPSISRLVQAMAPAEAASGHFKRARVEMLKGIRELLDKRIETLSKEPGHKGTKFSVE